MNPEYLIDKVPFIVEKRRNLKKTYASYMSHLAWLRANGIDEEDLSKIDKELRIRLGMEDEEETTESPEEGQVREMDR